MKEKSPSALVTKEEVFTPGCEIVHQGTQCAEENSRKFMAQPIRPVWSESATLPSS